MSDSIVNLTCTEDKTFLPPSPCEIIKLQALPDINDVVQWAWEYKRYPHLIDPRFRDEVIGESLLPDLWIIVCSYIVRTRHVFFSVPIIVLPIFTNGTACNAKIFTFTDFCGAENNESIDVGNSGKFTTIRGLYVIPCDQIPYSSLEIRLASTQLTTRIVYRCWINWMDDYEFPPSEQKRLILWNTEIRKTYLINYHAPTSWDWMSICWHLQKNQKFYDRPFVLSQGSLSLLDQVDM